MSHIWDFITGKTGDIANLSELPKISGEFFKKRKGAEGYVRRFAAPVFKGLGTEIKDIEAANLYKHIGKTYGSIPKTPEELSALAKKGFTYAEDIAKSRGGNVLNKTLLPK